jgi:hypothetical protein
MPGWAWSYGVRIKITAFDGATSAIGFGSDTRG